MTDIEKLELEELLKSYTIRPIEPPKFRGYFAKNGKLKGVSHEPSECGETFIFDDGEFVGKVENSRTFEYTGKSENSLNKKIRRFPSGAVRSDDTGRERPDFISPYAEKAVGEHFAANKNDFGATNYWLGIPELEVIASIKRHFLDLQIALHEGDTDLVRKEWQAITANCIMGLHTHELIRLGLYKEIHKGTELVEIGEQAKV